MSVRIGNAGTPARSRALIVVLAMLSGGAVLAAASATRASDGNPGRQAFFRYCSSCHGYDGRGDGEVASSLDPRPADLTQLAKKNGGTFPAAAVASFIDGSTRVAAHGTSAMPVWGTVFAKEASYEQPHAHAESQIRLITNYLSSIQTK
jgi:mono/diheme cytochrome c family protein